ncbi:uncharacterized protein LOC123504978 isoform X2 [Portunus trituberculatus]|uniref:uncharacterized protein LOC123504978 isoform X2 n=1 Tax=Portunus trituberculatus TaxID=210409 RepID=UPI001E1D072A|nr:uncharacterized protein LOC123504978 isoform X2 [Portunus trituberculatus]
MVQSVGGSNTLSPGHDFSIAHVSRHHLHQYYRTQSHPTRGPAAMEGLSGSPEGDGDSEGSVRGGVEGKNNKSGPWTQTPRENAESEANGDEGGEGSPVIRLLVLGGHAVGKSDIIYRHTLHIDDFQVDLEIVDISSRPGDNTLPTMEICQCDCYLVVYSVAERDTFLTANQLLHAIFKLRPHSPRPPITLLGNKQDLEHSRQVSPEEGATTSTVFGCDFAEVSVAETSEDIVPVFTSLIRRAREAACLCPASLTSPLNRMRSPLPALCRHVDGRTCRLCFYKGKELKDWGSMRSGGPSRTWSDIDGRVGVPATEEENMNIKNCRNKKQVSRSLSSPLQNTKSLSSQNLIKESPESQLCSRVSQTPQTKEENATPQPDSILSARKETSAKNIEAPSGHAPLARSFSSPDGWSEGELDGEDFSHSSSKLIRNSPDIFAQIKLQPTTLPLFTRGRSFIMDSVRTERSHECQCGIQKRTRSFKSSGKVEIVTLKKAENKQCNKEGTAKLPLGGAAYHENSPSKIFTNKLLKRENGINQRDRLEEKQPSTLSLPAASRTPRSPRWLPLDSLDASVEDGCNLPNSSRQRKFSVFGVGRALGNFLSKGSLPDLPRATANICDKFGSLKKTIKKRSV